MSPAEQASYREAILRVFRESAEPLSTRSLAHRCIEAGVFPDEWLESAAIRAVQTECRDALKTSDIRGLPFAGKTVRTDEDGSPLWAQRDVWDYATYEINIVEHATQARQNIDKAALLADECRGRYGRAPAVPMLIGAPPSQGAAD